MKNFTNHMNRPPALFVVVGGAGGRKIVQIKMSNFLFFSN